MRCGCPQCETYMAQQERGVKSKCVCPNCRFSCDACMGTDAAPMSKEELRAHVRLLRLLQEEEQEQGIWKRI
ncbi:MAG: hypothetical protein LBS18_05100 [Clostridiales bacterium]|nr:hypothetical protein [Clostridiales bacterium]